MGRKTARQSVSGGYGLRGALTLIELLVVISLLVLLMTILLPTVERARKHAKAVACQARLRQWSLVFKMYADANQGRWFDHWSISYTYMEDRGWVGIGRNDSKSVLNWPGLTSPFWFRTSNFAACPMATKGPRENGYYDAFTAWLPKEWGWSPFPGPSGESVLGPISYSLNQCVARPGPDDPRNPISPKDVFWGVCDVRGAARIPVFFDSVHSLPELIDVAGPPLFEAGPWHPEFGAWPMCINRHDGGVNMLFMDWSVRKVGLKELWTFKWYKIFNTAGPWTKAGGVLPEDWPPWMRRFKDY